MKLEATRLGLKNYMRWSRKREKIKHIKIKFDDSPSKESVVGFKSNYNAIIYWIYLLPNSVSAPAVRQAGGARKRGVKKLWRNVRGGGMLLNFSFLNRTSMELELSNLEVRLASNQSQSCNSKASPKFRQCTKNRQKWLCNKMNPKSLINL